MVFTHDSPNEKERIGICLWPEFNKNMVATPNAIEEESGI